jgi:uncharacterized protein YndB with AHSA1/START domain
MQERSVIHSTFVIERNYPASPERVFNAFSNPASKRRWFIESANHTVEQYDLDFRVGGKESACVRFKPGSPLEGVTCTNDTFHLDIVPNRRVVIVSSMYIGDKRISASLSTIELLPAGTGTDLVFTHQGAFFEGADGPAMRQEGWRKLFERLYAELQN